MCLKENPWKGFVPGTDIIISCCSATCQRAYIASENSSSYNLGNRYVVLSYLEEQEKQIKKMAYFPEDLFTWDESSELGY